MGVGEFVDPILSGMSENVIGLDISSLISFCFDLNGNLIDYDCEKRHAVIKEVNEENISLMEMYGTKDDSKET